MITNDSYVLLGVGGSGMSSLAHILLDRKEKVFGYDKKNSKQTEHLKQRGLNIFSSLSECLDKIPDQSVLVYSSAIVKSALTHPTKTFRIVHRSALLHQLFSQRTSIAIAGSHGKTTTTAMVAQILIEQDLSPAIMVGGDVPFLDFKGGVWGSGEYAVYESDESDGTFLNHSADYRIITNIDDDHLDHYKEKENLLNAFLKYATQSDDFTTFLYIGDPGISELLPRIDKRKNIILVGQESDYTSIVKDGKVNLNDFKKTYLLKIEDSSAIFNTYIYSSIIPSIEFQVPYLGEHYLINASLAIALCLELGIEIEAIIRTLSHYKGVKRRLEILGNYNTTKIVDDYGHHPTEVKAVLSSLQKEKKKNHLTKTIVLFQPHRFTRTQFLFQEFAQALTLADEIYLLPIYSAGESEIEGVSSELIQKELKNLGKDSRILQDGIQKDVEFLKIIIGQDKNILVTLGAGDVVSWGLAILK